MNGLAGSLRVVNGLIKIGPLAMAMVLRLIFIGDGPPACSSVVQSCPPSRLVVCVPGSAETTTSKVCSLERQGGMRASTSTTAELYDASSCCGLIFPKPVECFPTPILDISLIIHCMSSCGHSGEPVPSSPTTSPIPLI